MALSRRGVIRIPEGHLVPARIGGLSVEQVFDLIDAKFRRLPANFSNWKTAIQRERGRGGEQILSIYICRTSTGGKKKRRKK